jgi:hypothetical protein
MHLDPILLIVKALMRVVRVNENDEIIHLLQ